MFALFMVAHLHSFAVERDPYWNLYCDKDGNGWVELDYDDKRGDDPRWFNADTRWPVKDKRCSTMSR
jgi:hypothetical protein